MTATEKIEAQVNTMSNAQIEVTYDSIFRFWVKGGRSDLGLSRLIRMIEEEMDSRGMDTDAIIDRVIAA